MPVWFDRPRVCATPAAPITRRPFARLVLGRLRPGRRRPGLADLDDAALPRDLKDTDYYHSTSSGAVQHTLSKGTEYWVYQEATEVKPGSAVGCDLTVGGHQWHQTLKSNLPFSASDSDSDEGKQYHFIGHFAAPTSGPAFITCPALADKWMLTRDSTGIAVWALGCCLGCFVLPLALLLIGFVAWRRRRAHEKFERDPWGRW